MSRQAFMLAQRRMHAERQRLRFSWVTAHEAGHAVIAAAFDCAVEELEIGFDAGSGVRGSCYSRNETLPVFSCLVLLAAGGLAERKLPYDSEIEIHDWQDRQEAYALALAECHNDVTAAHALIERARKRADEILTANWNVVCALAAVLNARGRMSGDEAEPFLRNVSRVASRPSPAPARSRPAPTSDLLTRSESGQHGEVVDMAWCPRRQRMVPTFRAL